MIIRVTRINKAIKTIRIIQHIMIIGVIIRLLGNKHNFVS
jgi:hypothetical protein